MNPVEASDDYMKAFKQLVESPLGLVA